MKKLYTQYGYLSLPALFLIAFILSIFYPKFVEQYEGQADNQPGL